MKSYSRFSMSRTVRGVRGFRGFTLIELLVVMSIISLLIALLLPALGRSRFVAQVITCGTNERQQGYGMFAYAADSKDFLPVGPQDKWYASGLTRSGGGWSQTPIDETAAWARDYLNVSVSGPLMLAGNNLSVMGGPAVIMSGKTVWPYGTKGTILSCPGARGPEWRGWADDSQPDITGGSTSYWYTNLSLHGAPSANPRMVTMPTNSAVACFYVRVSRVSEQWRDWPFGWSSRLDKPLMIDKMADGMVWTNSATPTNNWMANHNLEGGNYLMPDGHVQWVVGDPGMDPFTIYGINLTPYNPNNKSNLMAVGSNQLGNNRAGSFLLSPKCVYLRGTFEGGTGNPHIFFCQTNGNSNVTTIVPGNVSDSQW